MFRRWLTLGIGVVATCAALPVPAFAGTYTVTQTTSSDLTGWAFSGSPGFSGCSAQLSSGVCASLAAPRALYAVGSSAAAAGATGAWTWTAPSGVAVSSGSVSVYWTVAAKSTTAWMKTQAGGQSLGTQPRINEAGGSSTTQWSIPSGTQAFQVGVGTSAAVTYGSGLSNLVKISKLQLTLQDTTNPVVGALLTTPKTGWFGSSTSSVCVDVSADDTGSGVTEIDLKNAAGTVLASYKPGAQSVFQPGAASVDHSLCVPGSKLAQGAQTLQAVATDAAGNTSSNAVSVQYDSQAPQVVTTTPTGATNNRQPSIGITLDGGASGIASASATLDGTQPLVASTTGSNATLALTPATALSTATHTVTWTATDNAGNTASGKWSFSVGTAPAVSATGALVANAYIDGSQNTCAAITVSDAGGSIAEVDVKYDSGKFLSSFKGPATAGATVTKNVCITPNVMGSGAHTLHIMGTDSAGHTFDQTYSVGVNIPVLTDLSGDGWVVWLTFDGGPSGVSYVSCSTDDGVFSGGGSENPYPFNIGNEPAGPHTVYCTATNGDGQSGSTTFKWTAG